MSTSSSRPNVRKGGVFRRLPTTVKRSERSSQTLRRAVCEFPQIQTGGHRNADRGLLPTTANTVQDIEARRSDPAVQDATSVMGQRRDRQIHNRRSAEVNFRRFAADLRSTAIWWRRARSTSRIPEVQEQYYPRHTEAAPLFSDPHRRPASTG